MEATVLGKVINRPVKQHGLVAMKQRHGHSFIGDTMKTFILRLRDHTKKTIQRVL